jgi:hypothetical protein
MLWTAASSFAVVAARQCSHWCRFALHLGQSCKAPLAVGAPQSMHLPCESMNIRSRHLPHKAARLDWLHPNTAVNNTKTAASRENRFRSILGTPLPVLLVIHRS